MSEEIYEEPHPGEKTSRYGRQQLRRMIKRLEKWGIVKILQEIDRDHLVLVCCLASTDECVQKKADTFCSEKGDTLCFDKSNSETAGCDIFSEKGDTGKNAKTDIPPVSGNIFNTKGLNNNNVKFDESLPVDNSHEETEQKPHAQLNAQPSTQKQRKSNPDAAVITRIFEHWKAIMNHPRAKLDDKRKRDIRKGLKLNFTEDELKQAITGCSKSAFHMGQNDRNEVYDGLGLIFRNADKIENFIAQADKLVLSHLATGGMKHGLQRTESNYERIMRQGVEFYERNEPLF
ncbi:hypothetical protein [Candidiatus Paracoxiella cheracis]|uniref:hypothetical protein n=1 Tax=Candidiatus Paracoxiella cheracis TaxID=3405120 RepID=UPI003BF4F06A